MALTYKPILIEHQGGENAHYTIHAEVTAGSHTATFIGGIAVREDDTLATIKAKLDTMILNFAQKVQAAKTLENDLQQYIGQTFTVG